MRTRKEQKIAYLFTLPAFLFLLGIFIYPLFYGLYLSLHSTKAGFGSLQFKGFANYIEILSSNIFWIGFKNTIIYSIGGVGLTVGIGLLIALLLNSIKKGRAFYRTLLIIPLGICPVVSSMTWQMMFNPLNGIINYVLTILHLPTSMWHTEINTAMITVIIIETWQWTPFPLLIIYSGLQMVPEEPLEAALIDGASTWQRIRYITIPMVWPIIAIAIIFRVIGTLRSFDIIHIITKGGPGYATDTLINQAFQKSFSFFKLEYGLVVGNILLILTIIICIFLVKTMRKR